MDEWIKEMWYVYTKEYYSVLKEKEILPLAMIWMGLEDILVNEYASHRANAAWFHLLKIIKLIEAGDTIVVARAWRVREMRSYYSTGTKFQFC